MKRIQRMLQYLRWMLERSQHESVYFYTLHKCASTLFAHFLLQHARGLKHCDYASRIYLGRQKGTLRFASHGYLYGPIRISAKLESPVYSQLVAPAIKPEFAADKRAVFFIRDPRDILVSQYYSFGFTHGLSPVERIRQLEKAEREFVRSMDVDAYVVHAATKLRDDMLVIDNLASQCRISALLRYEDMINDFDRFRNALSRLLDFDPEVLEELYRQSRPRESEDTHSHKRSGRVGDYAEKLRPETVSELNAILMPVLNRFGYDL